MKLSEMRHGSEYIHEKWGRVMVIYSHPHDGALLIVERQETIDPDDDDRVLDYCEASDLREAPSQDQWPYLGFTSRERSKQRSHDWGARHGWAETPEGSGRWHYTNGEVVPHVVWMAAWHKDYNAP